MEIRFRILVMKISFGVENREVEKGTSRGKWSGLCECCYIINKNRSGIKKKDKVNLVCLVRSVHVEKRSTIRLLAHELELSRTVVSRMFKEKILRKASSHVRPLLKSCLVFISV